MKFGSLFAGIGGLDLGLEASGMECAWQVEYDEFCKAVLKERWPDIKRYGDIFKLDAKELESVDLICGGFPCQPVSQAGKRAGTSDERWLWPEFARIIRSVRPKWVVVENVTGLLSANSGRAFAEVLRDLAESRYDAIWDVFPSGGPSGVGAPHKRARIFIIAKLADSESERHRGRNSKERDIKRRKLQQSEQTGCEMGCETEGCCESHGNVSNSDSERLERKERKRKTGKKRKPEGYTSQRSQWATEPNVGRVADGIPNRLHRLKALGNAVVPQVAEKIGNMIMEMENKRHLIVDGDNTCPQCGASLVGNALNVPLYCTNGHLYKRK
jgi:DNA (cytosine-5)-methyltransferase 1